MLLTEKALLLHKTVDVVFFSENGCTSRSIKCSSN